MIKNNEELRHTLSQSSINFMFRIFGLGSSFLTILIISRLFGITNYGSFSLILTISQAVTLIFTFGLPNALIFLKGNQKLSIEQTKRLLLKGITTTTTISIIPVLIFFSLAEFLASLFKNPDLAVYFRILAFSLPFLIVHELLLNYFISIKKFMFYNLFMFGLPNVLFIVLLLLFFYLEKLDFYVFLAYVIAIIFIVVMELFLVFRVKFQNIETTKFTAKELLRVASPMMFSSLLLYLLNWTDVIILGLMTDEKQVGIYNIAYKIGSVGFLVLISFSTIITPKMAELFGNDKLEELKKLIHQYTRLIAILTLPVVLTLIFLSDFILAFFGTEVTSGATTLIIVAISVLLSATAGNVDQILNMTNHQVILKNITIISFFINVILNIVLIPNYGIIGSAFSSLISTIVINLLCVIYIKKKLGFYTLF